MLRMFGSTKTLLSLSIILAFSQSSTSLAEVTQGSVEGSIASPAPSTSVIVQQVKNNAAPMNYATAKPLALPTTRTLDDKVLAAYSSNSLGTLGFAAGGNGNGKERSVTLISTSQLKSLLAIAQDDSTLIAPQEYGTTYLPFTTSRVDVVSASPTLQVSKSVYYRRTGKLFFSKPTGNFVCSASLIKP